MLALQIALDVLGELLEDGRGRAAAAGAGGDDRHEGAKAHRLQDFLRDLHLERAVAAGLGRQRDADRVADPFLQQDAERGGGGDDALRAHAGLGQAEMDRVVAARREHAVDGDQVLHAGDLGREDDAVARQADLLGARAGEKRRTAPSPRASPRRRRADRRASAFSSIRLVRSSWSSEPQFTPMRTGFPYLIAISMIGAELPVASSRESRHCRD